MEAKRKTSGEKAILDSICGTLSGARWEVRYFFELDSTMNAARELAPQLAEDQAALVIADRQYAGRGRQGRVWDQALRGFYGTFVFPLARQIQELPSFSLVTGVVVAEYFTKLGVVPELKWPNDILLAGRKKCAGILLESFEYNRRAYVLVGIGVNLEGAPDQQMLAAALADFGVEISTPELVSGIANTLHREFLIFEKSGFSPFRERWLAFSIPQGEQIRVHHGESIKSGTFEGISQNGELLLGLDGAVLTISSGEVLLSIGAGL